jgi:hypothetical protein
MYSFLIVAHSFFRWLVLLSLLFAIYRAYVGWLTNKIFTPLENSIRNFAATITNIQFLLGLWLYFKSPLVGYFWGNFQNAIHERDSRFFGIEHITMMFIAVSIINTGSGLVKKRTAHKAKFKTIAIWFSVGLTIIFLSIPWKFSPFTRRPYLRTYSQTQQSFLAFLKHQSREQNSYSQPNSDAAVFHIVQPSDPYILPVYIFSR